MPSSVLLSFHVAHHGFALPLRSSVASNLSPEVFRGATSPPRMRGRIIRSQALRLFRATHAAADLTEVMPDVAARRRFEPEGHPRRIRNLPPIPWAAPLLRFGPLQRHQQEESFLQHERRKRPSCRLRLCLGRNLAAFRVSHSLDGLLLFRPCQLVSSDKHSWGLNGPLPNSAAAVQPIAGCAAVDTCSGKPSRGIHTERT